MKNKKTIYLHIGMPKTGSTTIQHFLFKNRDKLEEKGVLYPIIKGSTYYVNLHPFLRAKRFKMHLRFATLSKKTMYKRAFKKYFLKDIESSACDKIILSDEILSEIEMLGSFSNVFVDILKEFGFDVKVVVYIRPAVDWIASWWQQAVKSFSISLDDFLLTPKSKPIYKMPDFIEKVGAENVIMKPFEKAQFKNGDLVADFLDAVGLELTEDFDTSLGVQNEGFGRNHLEFIRLINSLGHNKYTEFKLKCIASAPKDDIKVVESISDEQILEISNSYKDIYKKLANYYGKDTFFINDMPKCYGKERPLYQKLTLDKEQLNLLHDAIELSKNLNKDTFIEKIFSVKSEMDSKLVKSKKIRILGMKFKFNTKDYE